MLRDFEWTSSSIAKTLETFILSLINVLLVLLLGLCQGMSIFEDGRAPSLTFVVGSMILKAPHVFIACNGCPKSRSNCQYLISVTLLNDLLPVVFMSLVYSFYVAITCAITRQESAQTRGRAAM